MRNRKTRTSLQHQDIYLPILIIEEARNDTRVSIGKSTAYLRLPFSAPSDYKHEKLAWAKKWLLEALLEKPGLAERWKQKKYHTDQVIQTAFKPYKLQLQRSNSASKTLKAKIDSDTLQLVLPLATEDEVITRETISSLISKVISKDLLSVFQERVKELNSLHFQETYVNVRLKHIHTRWGSCATNGNLNFSTRILLAPPQIMDHVIIHELAHLKEMNHGPRFWKWVEKADPEYKKHDRWLTQYGEKLEF